MSSPAAQAPADFATWIDLLRWRAEHQTDLQALTFLDDERPQVDRLTYAELDRRSRAIAARLQSIVRPGDRALMLYAPGLDYVAAFFGCLYGGVIAVPAYPPRPRTLGRLQSMLLDAQPAVILSTRDLQEALAPLWAEAPGFPALPWETTDALPAELADDWRAPQVDSDDLAFLQYTSGSTSAPRGVMVSHANLLHNSRMIYEGFDNAHGTSGVIWLPLYHDMGLIGGVLQPVYAGLPVTLMSPLAFLQRPFRWLQAISETKATTSGGPNFAYDLCARKITPEQRATLDLSSWKLAFSGAEPVRPETLARFTETFEPCGFRATAWFPCYGLAEATLYVSGTHRDREPRLLPVSAPALETRRVVPAAPEGRDTQTLVSCGRTDPDLALAIVDPDTLTRMPTDGIGEIWLSGPTVARGYWNRPDDTEKTFRAHIVGDEDGRDWLRTGDLGFTHEGELYIAGRIKDLIIIDGRNHYPQDIEQTVEAAHPAIRPTATAAFAVEGPEGERLVVVAELEREHMPGRPGAIALPALTQLVRRAIAEQHAVQLHELVLLKTGYIPKTTSGKIQRHACRLGYLEGTLNRVEEKQSPP